MIPNPPGFRATGPQQRSELAIRISEIRKHAQLKLPEVAPDNPKKNNPKRPSTFKGHTKPVAESDIQPIKPIVEAKPSIEALVTGEAIITPKLARELKSAVKQVLATRALELYKPYEKQRNFHAAGMAFRERLLLASNQSGKSWCGAAELAMHLSGLYPNWWPGMRYDEPVTAWAIGHTTLVVRDTMQRLMFGRLGQLGTGFIPDALVLKMAMTRGISDAIDTASIRHVSGGISNVSFKSFEQGKDKLMGETIRVCWIDEECPSDIYSEILTRTNAFSDSRVFITFTPLSGLSDIVRKFYPVPNTADRHLTRMELTDAGHYTDEQRQRIWDSYPEHEREARTKGLPMLGSGMVFPVAESSISCEGFPIPPHWKSLIAVDFGIAHPFAASKLAFDEENDTVYVTNIFRQSGTTPIIHAAAIKPWGEAIPVAWPGDGLQLSKDTGIPLMEIYRNQGLNMLTDRAQFESGSVSVEAGIMEMLERFQTGRLKVFSHCTEVFEELRGYYRKNGAVIKEHEDCICCIRYGIMSLRFAEQSITRRSGPIRRNIPRVI